MSRPSFKNLFPGANESGLVGPTACNDGVAPSAPIEDHPVPDWQVSIEQNAMADAINYLRKDPNIPTLDLILSCRWPVTRVQASDIIAKAQATIASESAPVGVDDYFRESKK